MRRAVRPLVLLAALLPAGCATTPVNTYEPGNLSDDVVGLETTIRLSPDVFPPGKGTTITITFTNTIERAIVVTFPETRQVILLVRDEAGDIAYTDDRTIAVPTYLSLGTFESWHREMEWNGEARFGDRKLALAPGRYRMEAGIRRAGVLFVNGSAPVGFEVVAPDAAE